MGLFINKELAAQAVIIGELNDTVHALIDVIDFLSSPSNHPEHPGSSLATFNIYRYIAIREDVDVSDTVNPVLEAANKLLIETTTT